MQTQWRTGMAGATGLDYMGVRALLDERGLEPGSEQRRDTFACIQAAERATLDVWAEQRKEDARQPGPMPGPPPGL